MLRMPACSCVLLLSLMSAAAASGCWWMDNRFNTYHEESLKLLDQMAANTTEDAENPVAFPKHVYERAAEASVADRLALVVQILQEVGDLFDQKNTSSSAWDERTLDSFLNIIHEEKSGLQSCLDRTHGKTQNGKGKNRKLCSYFTRLSRSVLKGKQHSAEAWEMIRKEVQMHLFQASRLIPTKTSK
ncbi:interferon a3-like [Dunckerocampus dactyliophorus]|uniref:interferon a3-like n=1 Tax=Dunckerocampus dactyliophorus TaxID=161453 RepID=UPI00240676F4|nr:interferon a3-like [Dunckerocampus dactyliophorus]